ncbi:MAG: DUF2635 domain-containing protein [Pseudodesulfovibrio sp.]|nr:DUF2635 domain-containing protein [Pseudodesulfovibrio sp.]
MFVKPKKDLKVRDPQTGRHLPSEGAGVEQTSYWLRRIKAGDVEKTKAPKAASKE